MLKQNIIEFEGEFQEKNLEKVRCPWMTPALDQHVKESREACNAE